MEGGNTFVDLLKTIYEIKSPDHEHSQKKAVFANLLFDIGTALERGDYREGLKALRQCIVFFRSEPNIIIYKITEHLFQAVEKLCCYCYYKLNENFSELSSLIHDETKLTMFMLTINYMEERGLTMDFIANSLMTIREYLYENNFTCDEFEIKECKKKKGKKGKTGKKDKKDRREKIQKIDFAKLVEFTNTLNTMFSDDSIPEKAEVPVPETVEERKKTETPKKTAKKSPETPTNSSKEIKSATVVIQNEPQVETVQNNSTQTEKPKCTNISVQTDKPKHKNASIQADLTEIAESQILTIVTDIKKSINKTNKKDEEIDELKKQLAEEKENFKNYRKQVAEENDKKLKSLEVQCAGLRITVTQLEAERKANQEKLISVNRILLSQLEFRRNLQNVVFNFYENKCRQTLHFLKGMRQFVIKDLVSSNEEFHNFVKMWKTVLKNIETQKHQYMADFDEMEKSMRSGKNHRTLDWPNIHDPSNVELFAEFVNSTIRRHEEFVQQSKSGKNLKRQPPDAKKEALSARDSPEGSEESKKSTGSQFKPKAAHGNASGWQSHKSLYVYLMENTGLSEEVLCSVLTTMTMKNKDSVCGRPKEQILKEVRKLISTNKSKNPWANTHKNVQWQYEDAEKSCPICFEEYNDHNVYMLPCKHEFHKKCIQTWLKTGSCCPICRVHTPFEGDFPALKRTF
ncbi:unnamed protein product [Brassicogethes aeneus]|uniref:RING-type domain-containing protein n=1 Tax=Brassicogethes aeneus TaxID=1431903 RepID=A0A9P0FMM9_BRAAE|nr:unnamed protein product [Brassicogethes aeneus]